MDDRLRLPAARRCAGYCRSRCRPTLDAISCCRGWTSFTHYTPNSPCACCSATVPRISIANRWTLRCAMAACPIPRSSRCRSPRKTVASCAPLRPTSSATVCRAGPKSSRNTTAFASCSATMSTIAGASSAVDRSSRCRSLATASPTMARWHVAGRWRARALPTSRRSMRRKTSQPAGWFDSVPNGRANRYHSTCSVRTVVRSARW